MKRLLPAIYIAAFFVALFVLLNHPLFAAEQEQNATGTPTDVKEQKKNEAREELKEMEGTKAGLLNKIREKVTARAGILGAKITAKSGTTLTIGKDSKTYIVNTDTKTQFRR